MAYDESLANRMIELLSDSPGFEEKRMFGGVCFMLNGKMCMGVIKDEMMVRFDPALEETLYELPGCTPMNFTGRPMKGYALISQEVLRSRKDLQKWIEICLSFNAALLRNEGASKKAAKKTSKAKKSSSSKR
jgi:TfoX/Sxy family transcriptional regulator of competence genes